MRIIERYPAGIKAFRGRGAWSLLAPLRYALASVYGVGWRLRTAGRKDGSARAGITRYGGEDDRPLVISVGNLEVGGSGKTPCTIALAEQIISGGGDPVVVTRGYGSAASNAGAPVVLPSGGRTVQGVGGSFIEGRSLLDEGLPGAGIEAGIATAAVFGDEAPLYSNRGISLVIDPVRTRGVECAAELFDPTHILLDDAFQHTGLARDADIVLLDHARPLGNGWLLPAGTLREPPSVLRRADAVIFTRSSGNNVPGKVEKYLKDIPVFFSSHEPVDLLDRKGRTHLFSSVSGRTVTVFSGIARPESFEQTVTLSCGEPELSFRYADHHIYTEEDVSAMLGESSAGTVFITTEKDWGKSSHLFPEDMEIYALRVSMDIEEMGRLAEEIGL